VKIQETFDETSKNINKKIYKLLPENFILAQMFFAHTIPMLTYNKLNYHELENQIIKKSIKQESDLDKIIKKVAQIVRDVMDDQAIKNDDNLLGQYLKFPSSKSNILAELQYEYDGIYLVEADIVNQLSIRQLAKYISEQLQQNKNNTGFKLY
jgi:hypothetical protein